MTLRAADVAQEQNWLWRRMTSPPQGAQPRAGRPIVLVLA